MREESSYVKQGILGAILAAVAFLVLVRGLPGILYTSMGPKIDDQGLLVDGGSWLGTVMSDWISLGTFVLFGFGTAMLLARARQSKLEQRAFDIDLFSHDPDVLVLPDDVAEVRRQLNSMGKKERSLLLVQLISSGVERARANWDSEDVGNAISTKAEIIQDAQEASYSMVKYVAWAIPSVGFIGTVLGIGKAMAAMNSAGTDQNPGTGFDSAVAHLSTAFNTTFVALVLSLILMLLFYLTQGAEDGHLAKARQWCLDRFVLKMYKPQEAA